MIGVSLYSDHGEKTWRDKGQKKTISGIFTLTDFSKYMMSWRLKEVQLRILYTMEEKRKHENEW